MHAVLGDGEMERKELTETLADIWKADEKAGNTFWFLLQGKAEPTDTDKAMVTWLEKNDIYYEVITDDEANMDAIYSQPQEVHTAKRLAQKVVNLLKEKPEEGEEAEVLALFVSSDPEAEEDRWLNAVCQSVYDAEFPIRAFNDGLVEVDLSGDGEEPKEEEVEEPAKSVAKKAPVKKAAAQAKADTKVSEEDETPSAAAAAPSRAALEDMDLDQLKEVASNLGITLPPRTRMNTYIEAILGEAKPEAPAAEITPSPEVGGSASINGFDIEELAALIASKFLRGLKEALSEV
jgi:pyruvate/2-oxoglutarate dehydrogenase complex dihydrolipoamide acyltransferase (E2) component